REGSSPRGPSACRRSAYSTGGRLGDDRMRQRGSLRRSSLPRWNAVGIGPVKAHELVPWLFLAASIWGAWFTYNALWPMHGGARRTVFSFFAGWLTTELAVHHVAWQTVMTAVLAWAGALG